MRLFLAGTSFKPTYGGPALSVARLGCALAQEGVTVGLWSADGSVMMHPDPAATKGLVRLDGSLKAAISAFGRMDLIHDNGLWLPHNHELAVLAGHWGVPRLVSTRGMLEPWALRHKGLKKKLAWALYQRRDLCWAACLHATSAMEGEHLRGLGLGVPIRVVPNGVDVPAVIRDPVPRASEPAGGRRVALFLGRLYPVKGLPMLIDAWAQVRPEGWCLRILGPDEAGHRHHLARRILGQELVEWVSLDGAVYGEEKALAYQEADLFVLPSYSENFGMAVGEALAHGVPVLTTTAVPWPGLASRGCGWQVEPTEAGLIAGLRAATALEPGVLAAMGQRGRAWVAAEFAWETQSRRMLEIYAELLGQGNGVMRCMSWG